MEVLIVDLVADFAGQREDVWRHCRSRDRLERCFVISLCRDDLKVQEKDSL